MDPQDMSKKGLIYIPNFVKPQEKAQTLKFLKGLHPIWEMRFSPHNPPPAGQSNRQLLRPVYWLGNWQFACLDYYHPPKGLNNRCVQAEAFPPVMAEMVRKIELMVKDEFLPKDIPRGWHLNTCLINYYGSKIEGEKKVDVARVGEHRDYEPGPVASISFGERARSFNLFPVDRNNLKAKFSCSNGSTILLYRFLAAINSRSNFFTEFRESRKN